MKFGRTLGFAVLLAGTGWIRASGAAEPTALPEPNGAVATPAAAAWGALPKIPERVSQLMQDRNYAEAVNAIDEAAQAKGAPRDYLAYLKGRALYLGQHYDAAARQYDSLVRDFPASPWVRRARFSKAVSLARKGDFEGAELIYRAEVAYLLSAERKQQIADFYLEFAEAYFQPKNELEHKPDYAKTFGFYGQALDAGPKPSSRIEIELQMARCQQLLNQFPDAAARYTQFIKDHPNAPSVVEARYRLGEVQQAQNQPEAARRTWQDLLAMHPDSKSDLIPKAAFNLSVTYALPNPANDEDLNLGVAALEAFLKRYPDHKLAPQAYLRIAGSYVARGRFADAVKSLRRFLAEPRYADRDELADARNLLGRSYQLQRKFPEALAAWREYLARHPSHHDWSEVQRQIVDTEYFMADDRAQAKQYDDARKLWGDFLAKYPLDPRDPNILYQFGLMHFVAQKYPEALADWRRLVSKYPGTNESSLGQMMIATTLEQRLGKLAEALAEYRKLDWGPFASQAQVAVDRLTGRTMGIATERIFRTGETPRIKLTSRNIESVTVRIYRVDLETYFRKMHVIHGVEGLAIALIDPDRTFEFKVPKYAEYQELESQIDIPMPALPGGKVPPAGAVAVTVSSKTLEATSLVLRSDLDLIVKCSRDELFVFAENMRTGQAWPKARLLISNGKQVFAEAATGDDGVFKQAYKELKEAGDVRVLALAGGSAASNVVSLEGVGAAEGLADKGYIYTDRPAYRAGQLVHVRGLLRRAVDDNFTIERGRKFTLDVFDPRNRSVWQEEVKLSEFGSFHARFVLPATSPAGDYRVAVHDDDGRTYSGAFQVHEYQLEPVRLTVETERRVYYRGEVIEGIIRAAFYYGAPLAGREVQYRLWGEPIITAKTDDKGEIHFKFPTRDFSESETLHLHVALPERDLHTVRDFFLSAQGFSFSLSTVRPVFTAGETFELTVKTLDAEKKPLAQKLTLNVLERTVVDGKVGEIPVEHYELTTDAHDGTVRQTLRLEKGAFYILRTEGIDRFGNPVSAQSMVQISDDADRVRLRILADRHTFKVGDKADVQFVWREEPALALLTFQGARVLDYRLVRLEKGVNRLSLPMSAKLAPNFDLTVSVMTDPRPANAPEIAAAPLPANPPPRRFHEAVSRFDVQREMHIALTPHRKAGAKGPIQPGEEMELSIRATDPQGKPVSAELSLAMVEQSLLGMFGANVGPIDDFFRAGARQSALRTSTSVTFAYHPATKPIDRHLLSEAERAEIAAEELERLKQLQGSLRLMTKRVQPGGSREVLVEKYKSVELREPEPAAGEDGRNLGGWDKLHLSQDGAVIDVDNLGAGSEDSLNLALQSVDEPAIPFTVDAVTIYPKNVQWEALTQRRSVLSGPIGYREEKSTTESPNRPNRHKGLHGYRYLPLYGKSGDGPAPTLSPQLSLAESKPDFDSLIDTIKSTITTDSWDSNGASGSVAPFETNLTLVVSQRQDVQSNLNLRLALGDKPDEKSIAGLAHKLVSDGAILLVQRGPQETGYWNPAIITDEKGQATVTITMPEQSTAWTLSARGITTDTLAGEAESELVVKKELFGELKLPLAFTDGDEAQVTASIHNDVIDKGPIELTLKTTIGSRSVEEHKTLDATAKGLAEWTFPATIRRPEAEKPAEKRADKNSDKDADNAGKNRAADGSVMFELTVAAGGRRDTIRRVVPIRPYGLPVYATAGGSASADTTVWVAAPPAMPVTAPSLQIIVGPTVERSLLDVLLGAVPSCQFESQAVASGIDTATSDLMAALALQKLLATTREAGGPEAAALDARIRSAVSLLVSSQREEDGGWSWSGFGGDSHRFTSARAVWALALARRAGYKMPDERFEKAKVYLQSQVAATGDSDYESKALLLHALAVAGAGDFTLANRLYRNRPALGNAALAHLALALTEMDRRPMADDLLKLLGTRSLDAAGSPRPSAFGPLPWNDSAAEVRALYALAQQQVAPESPKTRELADWLMAHRMGNRWSPDKATGPATMALAGWFGKGRIQAEHYKLSVFVNDLLAKSLDVDKATGTQTIDVPSRMLRPGKQRINFQLIGRGEYTFQAILGGFVAADKLKSTAGGWTVRRHYEPAPLELDGQEIPRGFDVLEGSFTPFRNPLTQLAIGRRGQVELDIQRGNLPTGTADERLEYLVVTEPLPSGTTLIESSISGGFERYEIGPSQITFYVGSRRNIEPIRFDVHGYVAGQYRAVPTVVRNAYRPDQMAVSEPKELEVLSPVELWLAKAGADMNRATPLLDRDGPGHQLSEKIGGWHYDPAGGDAALRPDTSDPYRLSPRELYELGRRYFEKGDYARAGKHLGELLAHWNVKPDIYKESARMLLDIHLAGGPPAEIVRYFEIIKEKWPDLELPFEKIVKVAAAYHEMGEYERSYLVFRATTESSFVRESAVAGFLEGQGEFLRSVGVMQRLLAEYPPEPYIAAATFALSQRIYAKAPEAAADPKLRELKINRVDLVGRALGLLDNFLTDYPDDPAADQAAFSEANALLERRAYKPMIARATQFAARYPKSDYLDSFWYITAYGHFALGQHDQALSMARRVAEHKRIDRQTGRAVESPNKWEAIYILGQVYHSLGDAAQAIAEYSKVADRFADAKQAIAYFTRQEISLPEVTTLRPGQPTNVELKFRNIATADVKVYRIDLMKYSLLNRNLADITQINLAGIRPLHSDSLSMGDGRDYRDRNRRLSLPLAEEGAYLVVCRGGDLYASGLVLISPLKIEVQEDAAAGQVRATVKDVVRDACVADVHAKVIGSRNEDFVSGQTDLRGIFVAQGIQGTSTVIARVGSGRYAFYRGQTDLGSRPQPSAAAPADPFAEKPAAQSALNKTGQPSDGTELDNDLLNGVLRSNSSIQSDNKRQLEQIYNQKKSGVKAKEAY